MFGRYFFARNHLPIFNYTKSISKSLNIRRFSRLNNVSNADVAEIIQKEQFNLIRLANVYSKINFENITSQEGQFLLKCCGTSSINSTNEERNQMFKNIYEDLVKYNKLDLDIYHTYIETCTENRTLINSKIFLENLKFQPDNKIYSLLLKNVCECGDLSQAFMLLEIMKHNNVPADENVFNSLALVHTLNGGLDAGEKVLATMKTAQVSENIESYIAILKGIIRTQNYEDFKKFLDKYKFSLDGNQMLDLLKELGESQTVNWLSEITTHLFDVIPTREFINDVKNISIYLIYLKKSDSAIKLYTYFQKQPEENYGNFILEEMLNSKMDHSDIISAAKFFLNNYNNVHIFESITEYALKHKYFDISWKLFKHFQELRPHYFWPLLLHARNIEGEAGIFKVIKNINNMGLKLDSDTLEHYILPFCYLNDIKSIIEKLKAVGFTLREVLSPVLLVLLKTGQVKKAVDLCELYNLPIEGERLFKVICYSWVATKDLLTVSILKKFCEYSNVENDLMGDFLIISLKSCKNEKDQKEFSLLLKEFIKKRLKVTTTTADILKEMLKSRKGGNETKLSNQILDDIDQILEFKVKTEKNYIPYPRDMKLDELECHLVELTEKNMETRGVLRRLIQMYANIENGQRVEQLRQQFLDAGYEETLGMRASLMYTYTKTGNLESALEIYKEIKKVNQKFVIDEHKIVDLATVLVKNDRFTDATSLLEEASKLRVYEGSGLQRNCLELLNAFSNESDQNKMLNLLVSKHLCTFNNIMLGPLVRIHLKSGNLEKAADTFINLTEKFKCTPLQYELIKEITKSKNEEILQKVLDSTSKIHGPLAAQVTLIGVLAELGEENILKKILTSTQLQIKNEVNKRCERWIKEGKSEALITLANSCSRMPNGLIDINFIYECIMKVYSMNNDCENALKFYEGFLEKELPIYNKLENQLYILLKQNNYLVPNSLKINSKK